MRKIYLLTLFLCLFGHIQAQTTCDSTYKDFTITAFKHLDKSPITSGVLYEYVLPFAGLDEFNPATDTTSGLHLMQAYQELYEASLNTLALTHPIDLNTALENFHTNPEFHHPVGVLDFRFHSIDSNAVANNQLTVSGNAFYDVPGRSTHPYLSHLVFLATPLLTESYDGLTGGSTHYLHFKNEFVLSNTGFNLSMVNHVEIRLNGSVVHSAYVSGVNNHVAPVYIPDVNQQNEIQIKFTLTTNFWDRLYLEAKSRVYGEEKAIQAACEGFYNMEVEGYSFGLPYAPLATANEWGIATVYFAHANCATQQITRPIIFVDGFDPNNKNDHRKIWDVYLNFVYRDGDVDKVLGDSLRAAGYDIIILDQKKTAGHNSGGSAFIERNGLVLAKLLTTLYNSYNSTLQDDFVVVGASMGGLVARYGLAWMESQNIPHHTRLFVSFDSPQNGAYIPLGMQYMVDNFMKNGLLSWSNKMSNALHNSAAAKQMLLLHSSTRNNSTDAVTAHPYRQMFLDNLAAVGNWPTQCRMVAINNGNRIGIKKNQSPQPGPEYFITPSEKIMDFGIKRRLMAGNWCSSDVCYKLRLKVWTQPESGKEIVHTFIQLGFNPLLQLLTFSGPITYKHSYNSTHNGQSLDIAPGSRIGQDYLGAVEGNIIGLSIKTILNAVTGRFHKSDNKSMNSNFIPSVSSTAYLFPNGEPLNYYKNFTGVTLSKCAGTTPFDTVYAPTYDMKHVGIDANIAAAFKSEMYFPKPSSACGSTPCPQHLVKNSTVPAGTTFYQAENSITLNPGFEVTPGKVFKAQTGGCNNGSNLAENSQNFGGSTPFVSECTFEWDTGKLHSQCEGSLTRYQVYVKNIPYDSYPEFSADGSTWFKAAIGSNGHEFLLPGTTGWTMYARIKNKPAVAIQYTFPPCSTGSTPINFNNTLRTKLCSGGQITQTVYVDNLPGGATAQFSTNGGSTWYNANVGVNGYSFTQTPTNTNQQFLARSTSHPGSYVTTNYHASCSNPATMDWGPWSVSTHSPGVCKYEVSVTGLATDSYAEFSVDDGGSWYKAQVGNQGHVFLLLWGNVSHQDFWFRPGERPDYSGTWGNLPMCSN